MLKKFQRKFECKLAHIVGDALRANPKLKKPNSRITQQQNISII